MASKKDMRRADLVVPYVEPEKESKETDIASALATTMPMMAMFTRNKMIGWVAVVFAVQTWLAETPESRKNAQTPGYLSVIMSFVGLGSSYMSLFLPPTAMRTSATGTEAQAPMPPS